MPVPKVIMLDSLHQYNCNRDANLVKIVQALEAPSRIAELRTLSLTSKGNGFSGAVSAVYPESLPISQTLSVATFEYAVKYILRSQRYRAALQTVEAVRLHAAATGQLPKRLEEVTSVNVPNDPTTGQPFSYSVSDQTAVLSSGKEELRLELSLRK